MGKYTGEKYCPSNGTDGMNFEYEFCQFCIHEKFMHTQKHGDKQCDIYNRAVLNAPDTTHPDYPQEWQYDVNDNPVCTAHVHWNWRNDDEGGLNEPPPPAPPDDPAQMCLPFEINEMEFEKVKELELA